MYDTVLDNCDLDAASFVVTMMEKAMSKLTSFLKCYGNFLKIFVISMEKLINSNL